jgi:hypothetical protein
MSGDGELIALIDFVYAAVLDGDLWPSVLAKLAGVTGTMQAIIATMDRRTNSFDSISRRTIAELDASYKNYWAFHNPLWAKSTALPVGAVYSLDSLMPRQDFAKTDIFNEWWKPAEYGLAMLGANLQIEDQVLTMLCVVNAPGNDALTNEQTRLFEAAVRHIARAVRIHRQLWTLDHMHGSALERFEGLRQGAILVDAAANDLVAWRLCEACLDVEAASIMLFE